MSMLIVEDQFMVAVGIEKTFRLAGASEVTIVGTMEDAWEAVAKTRFDADSHHKLIFDNQHRHVGERLVCGSFGVV